MGGWHTAAFPATEVLLAARVRLWSALATAILPLASLVAPDLGAQEGSGTVAGFVRDSAGAPVVEALVVLSAGGRAVYTDIRGAFQFDSVPPGTHTVAARRIGFTPNEHRFLLRRSESVSFVLVLLPRPLAVEQVVVLAPNVGVRGVVHDPDLNPIAGAEIRLTGTARILRTDKDGRFAWGRLSPGRYALRVTARGYRPRVFTVHIPRGESREVSIRMSLSDAPIRNADQLAWEEFGWRRRWSSSLSTFLVEEDLLRGGSVRLSDHVTIRSEAGDRPCIFVNGSRSVLPLEFFFTQDVFAVEIYPPGGIAFAGGRRRARPNLSLGQQMGGASPVDQECTSQVHIWLREP